MNTAAQPPKPPKPSTVTPIAPALEIDAIDAIDWSDSADVVVVGWGAAGACAAIEARASGASVLVSDRFEGGGASALSGGVVYAGGGTPHQSQAGFADTPQAMAEYLRHEVNGAVSDATLEKFCADSVANLAWLESQGARFGATMPDHKTSYPPEGKFLYYSGNEVVPACRGELGPPAPRGHRAVAKGQSGATLYAALQAATLRAGAQTITQAAVRRLVRLRGADGEPGAVVGIEIWQLAPGDAATLRHAALHRQVARWRTFRPGKAAACRREAARIELANAKPRFIRAHQGVVLSTGGFIYNTELIKKHAPHMRRGWPVGAAGCDGSGLRLGESVGAAAQALGNVSAWRFITPPSVWPKGVVVNAQGDRFCNEQVYGAKLGHELVDNQGGRGWLVLDGKLRAQAMRQCLFGGLWAFQSLPALAMLLFSAKKAATPEALAARIQVDPSKLRASLDAANAAARGEREDAFGKSADMRHDMAGGPFYALDISIGVPTFPLAVLTLGGLMLDETNGQVLDTAGQRIGGLFAAGRAAVGLPSSRYVSGLSLADCVFSGRRAGQAAASLRNEDD
jgi:3-oxo-5alpha-steroid 4-dehydrogenase